MELSAGQSVFLSFTAHRDYDTRPEGHVYRATVLDPEHRICKTEHGSIRVIESFERIHATAAAAWEANAVELEARAGVVAAAAAECRAKAAATGRIVAVSA